MKKLKAAISKSMGQFIGLCLYLFGTIFIGIFQDEAREILGDKILSIYNYLPIWVWIIIGMVIFVVIFVFNYRKNYSPEETTSPRAKTEYNQTHSGSGDNQIGDRYYFGDSDRKKDNAVPEVREVVYNMGMLLDKFEKNLEQVRNSAVENRIDEKFKSAFEELYKLLDEFLPMTKALLKNSDDIEETITNLNKSFVIYGATLQEFVHQKKAPLDSTYIKTGGQEKKLENEISLRSDSGKCYSDIKKYVKRLRAQLKENLP